MVIIEFLEFAHKNQIELAKHEMDEFRLYLIKNSMAHPDIGEFNFDYRFFNKKLQDLKNVNSDRFRNWLVILDPIYCQIASNIVEGQFTSALDLVIDEHSEAGNSNELSTRVTKLTEQIIINLINSRDVDQVAKVLKKIRSSFSAYSLSWGAEFKEQVDTFLLISF